MEIVNDNRKVEISLRYISDGIRYIEGTSSAETKNEKKEKRVTGNRRQIYSMEEKEDAKEDGW